MTNVVAESRKIKGSMVAIITPHNKDQTVDYDCLGELIDWQIDSGTDVIVTCGTTGESATMPHDIHGRVIEYTVKRVDGRVPVVAGTGSNSTEEALERTIHAKEAGADGALVVEPYYNKPAARHVFSGYFKPIASAVPGFPLVAYHVPGRTQGKLPLDIVKKLAEIPEYFAVKEASGNFSRAIEIVHECGDDLALLSGEDMLNYAMLAIGGKGSISVVANFAPAQVAHMHNLFFSEDYTAAKRMQNQLVPLNRAAFADGNPGSAKTALYFMGKIQPYAKYPIGLAEGENAAKIYNALKDFGIEAVNDPLTLERMIN